MNKQLRDELLERVEKEQKLRFELNENPDDVQSMMRTIETDAMK